MSDRYLPVPLNRMRRVGTLAKLIRGMPVQDPRYALFLGAGASKSSGIPTAENLIRQWQRRIFLDEKGLSTWRPSHQPAFEEWKNHHFQDWRREWEGTYGRHPGTYSFLFEYAYPDTEARQGFIEKICSGAEPGPGYIYLASLALAGIFQTFLTTNFDELIHDTLFRYGGLKPMVSAFDSQVSSVRLQSPRPKIIKLHGDFLYANLKTVGSEVSRLDRNMEEKFERTGENYGLIVVGYGGQDQSIMAPIRAMLHRQDRLKHGLHWCVYRDKKDKERKDATSVDIPEELYRMSESYPDKAHLYDVGSFDEVMETLYVASCCSPPPDLAHPEERALYSRLRDGIENADQTWRLTPHFSDLLSQFHKALARPQAESLTFLDQSDEKHRDAGREFKRKNFPGALRLFEAAIERATQALETASASQKVRALRRLSGSKTGAAETIFKAAGAGRPSDLDTAPRDLFLNLVDGSINDARRGLGEDLKLGSPEDTRGHRLNLWYNGLVGFAYRIFSGLDLSEGEKFEALQWLESLSGNDMFGSEFMALLEEELGGSELLTMLQDFSSRED